MSSSGSLTTDPPVSVYPSSFPLPRVTIQFCTQCKWMLRAAYFAQELLSTFSTSLGEVALQPSTGGTFIITIVTAVPGVSTDTAAASISKVIWDRKTDGGFPETKELKRRIRDVIDPERDLGHVDRNYTKGPQATSDTTSITIDAAKGPVNTKKDTVDSPNENMSAPPGTGGGDTEAAKKQQIRHIAAGPRWGGGTEQKVLLDGGQRTSASPASGVTESSGPGSSGMKKQDGKEEEKEPKKPLALHLMSSGSGRGVKIPPGNEAVKVKIEAANQAAASASGTGKSAGSGQGTNKKCESEVCEDCEQ